MPGFAAADPVTVIRGSNVTVVDAGGSDSWQEPRGVAPERGSEPASRSPTAPDDDPSWVVIVDTEASPETAWELVSPWEGRGIEVHDADDSRPSQIVTHRGPTLREASEIRVHGADGERSNPSAIRTLPFGGDESHIKVHGGRSQGPSRIRVHGVGRPM
jgi:hypothetical protein